MGAFLFWRIMKLKHISELRKNMTPEQIKKSDELFERFYGEYKNTKPIYCGPKSSDDEKYVKKVNMDNLE